MSMSTETLGRVLLYRGKPPAIRRGSSSCAPASSHDGDVFNADTVASIADAILNDEYIKARSVARNAPNVTVRKINDLTVEFTTKLPDPILDRRMALMLMFAPKAWADIGPEGMANNPIGSGTYKNIMWDATRITGTSFEEGWRVPKIKNIEFNILPENASRVQALCSGQVDLANQLTPDDTVQLESCNLKVILSPTNNTINLILRHLDEDSPVADIRVRQALNYAFDKQAFVDTVLHGTTRPAGQPATHRVSGYQDDIAPYSYDPEKAKQLLAKAGYPNGLKLMAEIVVTTGEFAQTFQAMASDFLKVGVELELRVITIPDLVSKILGRKQWEGDAFSMMYEAYPTADISRAMGTHSCLFFNKHTCFEEIMPTINAMNAEFDSDKRAALQRKIMQFYHENASAVFSHERIQVDGMVKNLQNYTIVNRTVPYHELTFN